MCLAQEQWIRDHRDKFFGEGKEEGREEERQSARKAMLFRFFSFNYLDEEIPKFFLECSENEFNSVTFSVIELPSMELLVLCPVRQLTGEQPQS